MTTFAEGGKLNLPETPAEQRAELLRRLETAQAKVERLMVEHEKLAQASAAASEKAQTAWSKLRAARAEMGDLRTQLVEQLP